MRRFDPSVPRKMFWAESVGDRSHVPECHSKLDASHMFVMLFEMRTTPLRSSLEMMRGLLFGVPDSGPLLWNIQGIPCYYFRERLPGQVHPARTIALGPVLGEKRFRPLGEDGNPVSLMKFIKKRGTDTNP